MWTTLLDQMLRHFVREGTLRITLPDGTTRQYGSGTPEVAIRLTDPALPRRIITNPRLAVGEAYLDGSLEIEGDDLLGFFALMIPSINRAGAPWFLRPLEAFRYYRRWIRQITPIKRARANVAHHYDLSGKLYDMFLDADRQYSCAYWAEEGMTLDAAQLAKKRHIAAKLCLEPGMRVLDIGCGWGGLALTLARDYGVEVVGVTLSEEQYKIATECAREEGLEDRVTFRLSDYREVPESFDRIVSVGMFEHVGVPQYGEFFRFVRDHLTADGLALIHTIGHVGPPSESDPWMAKYIFPGGYIPSLTEVQKAVDRTGLVTADIESLRLHYAKTLEAWADRFMAREAEARALYDERFVRMWRWYLVSCRASFTWGTVLVYQLQLSKKLATVPITRDYLYRDTAARTIGVEDTTLPQVDVAPVRKTGTG